MTEKQKKLIAGYKNIHNDIIKLLERARYTSARMIHSIMTATYWEIGRRLVEFEQKGAARAAYGTVLIERLATDLTAHFGRGFSRQNLQQMRLFYTLWPPQKICQTPSGELGKIDLSINMNATEIAAYLGASSWIPQEYLKYVFCNSSISKVICKFNCSADLGKHSINIFIRPLPTAFNLSKVLLDITFKLICKKALSGLPSPIQ